MRRSILPLCAALVATACGERPVSHPPAIGASRDLALVASGDLVPGAPLGSESRQLAVAAGRSGWLVVWSRPGLADEDLVGLRVAPSGEPLDAAPFVIAAAAGDEQVPAVAFDGQGWLVVWEDHRAGPYANLYAARVAEDGTLLDPAGIPICTREDQQRSPAVAFVDGVFVVAWADRRAGMNWDVYGARVAPDGTVLDPGGFAVSSTPAYQVTPAVAAGGGVALVVWQDALFEASIRAARITPSGMVLDAGTSVPAAAFLQAAPAVAFDGASFLVVWQDQPSFFEPDVRAARISPEGVVLDADALAVAASPVAERSPAVTSDARHAVVAWASGASGAAALQGVRVDGSGALVDDPPFGIAAGAVGRSLALAGDGEGRVLVVHDALDGLGGVTLRGRVLTTWARLEVARAGRGGGAVSSAPEGIDCGPACSAVFDGGASVTLVATPDADSVFGGWSGACTGTGPCTVSMDAARSVGATFLPLLAVDVTIAGPAGSVTSSPAGLACADACSARFPEGTTLQLDGQGTAGQSTFSVWSGDCSGTGACTLVVDAPKSVTASFVAARTLTLSPNGAGRGTLSAGGASCSQGTSCAVDLPLGSSVTITATPDEASILKTWSGCVASGPTCTASMTSPRYVSGRFDPRTLALTVYLSGQNGGLGAVAGSGIACASGSTDGCTAQIDNPPYTTAYASANLRATPQAGSVFKSWTGCTAVAGDPAACVVSMPSAKTVTAKFEGATIPLTAVSSGSGTGTITGAGLDCPTGGGAGCTAAVENPNLASTYTTVTLRAVPSPGSVFKSWTGCTAVAGDPAACTLLVSSPKYVSAKFEAASLPVNASATGTGTGAVTGAGLACSTGSTDGCVGQVENPANSSGYTTATLRAVPAPGSVFKSWTGCTAVAGDPAACTLLVSSPKYVSAKFEAASLPVNASATGTGTGVITGAGLACSTGSTDGCVGQVENPANSSGYTTATLRAVPAPGSVFKSWTGCIAVAGDPAACTLLVSSPKYVSAKFEPASLPLNASATGTGAGVITGAGLACSTGSTDGCVGQVENPASSSSYATVTLRALPSPGSVFKSWTGCTAVAGDPAACTLLVTSPKYVSAKFEPDMLSVGIRGSGAGAGIVTGPGLSCPATTEPCTVLVANPPDSASYNTITLAAAPDASSVFKGWSGCTVLADPSTCSLKVDGVENVTVRFEPSTYELTVAANGPGSVAAPGIACSLETPDGCRGTFPNGAAVRLVATPADGYILKSWSGCTPAADGSCSVAMTSARYVSASFQPATYPLTLGFSGSGAGSVTAGEAVCASSGGPCTLPVANGAAVTLVPTPEPGSLFTGWSGSCSGTGACTVTMSTSRVVYAGFASP